MVLLRSAIGPGYEINADLSIFTVTSFPVRLWNKLFMCAEKAGPENLSRYLFCNKVKNKKLQC